MTPLMPMYTLGHDFVPPPVHAGGLRYHGDAPSLCALVKEGLVEAKAIAADRGLRGGGALRPLRGDHPGAGARARDPRRRSTRPRRPSRPGEERVILFNLSGHGHFDMSAYAAYFAGELEDLELLRGRARQRRSSTCPRRPRSPEDLSPRLGRVASETRANRLGDRRGLPAPGFDEDVTQLALGTLVASRPR